MRGALRRVGAVALALVLVTTAALSGVGGPASPTGTASAEFVNCDLNERSVEQHAVHFALNSLTGNINTDKCHWAANSDTANVTATDAYASALGLEDTADTFTTTNDNFMNDTRSVAMSKAKLSMVNALNNGSSESQVHLMVNQTITEYYAQIELNIVKDYNARVQQYSYWNQNTSATLGRTNPDDRYDFSDMNGMTKQAYEYTLLNGSTTTIYVFANRHTQTTGPDLSQINYESDTTPASSGDVMGIKDPSGQSGAAIIPTRKYESLLQRPSNQVEQVKANMGPLVDATFSQYQAGDLNMTDYAYLDPSTIGSEAATSLNSTGYYSYASIQLAAMGATGNVSHSHTVNIGGSTYNGTLFYTGNDLTNGLETGTTYDVSDYSGVFYMAVQPSNTSKPARIVTLGSLGSSFTIDSATNTKTGEAVNTTVTHEYVYDTADASALQDEIDRLEALRDYYESQQSSGGGGGWGIGTEDKGLIALAAIALILIATRN